jgi:hypothetical protein
MPAKVRIVDEADGEVLTHLTRSPVKTPKAYPCGGKASPCGAREIEGKPSAQVANGSEIRK